MKTVAVFPYSPTFDAELGVASESIATVVFSNGVREIEIHPFLDSGADITVLPYHYGLRLGLEATGNPLLSYRGVAGGDLRLIVCRVGLRIGMGRSVFVRIGWAQTEHVDLLLGRLDVFNHFTFEFNHTKQEIRVKQ